MCRKLLGLGFFITVRKHKACKALTFFGGFAWLFFVIVCSGGLCRERCLTRDGMNYNKKKKKVQRTSSLLCYLILMFIS